MLSPIMLLLTPTHMQLQMVRNHHGNTTTNPRLIAMAERTFSSNSVLPPIPAKGEYNGQYRILQVTVAICSSRRWRPRVFGTTVIVQGEIANNHSASYGRGMYTYRS